MILCDEGVGWDLLENTLFSVRLMSLPYMDLWKQDLFLFVCLKT